jgi:hypothetical protein
MRLYTFMFYIFSIGVLSWLSMFAMLSTSNSKFVKCLERRLTTALKILTILFASVLIITLAIDLILLLF